MHKQLQVYIDIIHDDLDGEEVTFEERCEKLTKMLTSVGEGLAMGYRDAFLQDNNGNKVGGFAIVETSKSAVKLIKST